VGLSVSLPVVESKIDVLNSDVTIAIALALLVISRGFGSQWVKNDEVESVVDWERGAYFSGITTVSGQFDRRYDFELKDDIFIHSKRYI